MPHRVPRHRDVRRAPPIIRHENINGRVEPVHKLALLRLLLHEAQLEVRHHADEPREERLLRGPDHLAVHGAERRGDDAVEVWGDLELHERVGREVPVVAAAARGGRAEAAGEGLVDLFVGLGSCVVLRACAV